MSKTNTKQHMELLRQILWCLGLTSLVMVLHTTADPDLFARLAVGKLVAKLSYVPTQDPFAFTPRNLVWVDHEWLSGLIFYRIWAVFGELGLYLLKLICIVASGLLLLAAQRLWNASKTALILNAVTIFGSVYLWCSTIRAQVFTYVLFPLLLIVLHPTFRRRWQITMPLACAIFAFWANVHGGVVVGLGVLVIALFSALLRDRDLAYYYFGLLLSAIAGTLFNPYGARYIIYLFQAVTMQRPMIDEWDALSPFSILAILPNLYCLLLALGIRHGGVRYFTMRSLIIGATIFFAYAHYRLHALFLMAAVALGQDHMIAGYNVLTQRYSVPLRRVTLWVFTLLSVVGVFQMAGHLGKLPFQLGRATYPVAATSWLRSNRDGGRLLVDFNTGSFCIWELYPEFLVSVDGRYEELYAENTVRDVDLALNPRAAGHVKALGDIDPDFILSANLSQNAVRGFGTEWKAVYTDERWSVLEKYKADSGATDSTGK